MDDQELLAELRTLLAALDPPDRTVVEQARLAFGWRTIDAELAELSYDSLADREMMAAVRDGGVPGGGPRLIGFDTDVTGEAAGAVSIEVEVTEGQGAQASVVGQLMPPVPATVRVLRSTAPAGSDQAVRADELGRFRIRSMPRGPVRLRVELGRRRIETSWVCYVSSSVAAGPASAEG